MAKLNYHLVIYQLEVDDFDKQTLEQVSEAKVRSPMLEYFVKEKFVR